MRSTSRGSKEPTHYDDPLGLDDPEQAQAIPCPAPTVVTGLSEEEDAGRYMAREFNTALMFCVNCETSYDTTGWSSPYRDGSLHCPYCDGALRPMGSKPSTSKRKF